LLEPAAGGAAMRYLAASSMHLGAGGSRDQ
jgi:hypothetical protein